jgi:hypothetical protein
MALAPRAVLQTRANSLGKETPAGAAAETDRGRVSADC